MKTNRIDLVKTCYAGAIAVLIGVFCGGTVLAQTDAPPQQQAPGPQKQTIQVDPAALPVRPALACGSCHQDRNVDLARIPGAPGRNGEPLPFGLEDRRQVGRRHQLAGPVGVGDAVVVRGRSCAVVMPATITDRVASALNQTTNVPRREPIPSKALKRINEYLV